MAEKHPYTSGKSGISKAIAQLRKSFPATVNSDTLKKLGIAPNNETYIVNILRYLSIIDAEGKKNAHAASVLVKHDEGEFQKSFASIVEKAYSDLFDILGDEAWTATDNQLISFFRNTDHTSDIVGRRQATTFQALAAISGKTDGAPVKSTQPKAKKADAAATKKVTKQAPAQKATPNNQPTGGENGVGGASDMALTVRVEINLPAGGDKETYDNIFKSIRENLLNGKSS